MRRAVLLAAVAALTACGSSAHVTHGQPPRLPRAVALDLAARTQAVAATLDAGDSCRALRLAHALQQRSIAELARIPAAYQETLEGTINDLVARITCVPAPAPAPAPVPAKHGPPAGHGPPRGHGPGHDRGKAKPKDKGNGHGPGGDGGD